MKPKASDSELLARIEALERAVFGAKPKKRSSGQTEFKGATGGLRLLISKAFFDRRRPFPEIGKGIEQAWLPLQKAGDSNAIEPHVVAKRSAGRLKTTRAQGLC